VCIFLENDDAATFATAATTGEMALNQGGRTQKRFKAMQRRLSTTDRVN
jgi:hypothetical protein